MSKQEKMIAVVDKHQGLNEKVSKVPITTLKTLLSKATREVCKKAGIKRTIKMSF